MEIRDPVHGTLTLSDAETAVVDTPEYQRLRLIRQLGFSEYAYPAATHNRYLHSLGVCHLAGLAFNQVFSEHKIPEKQFKLFRSCVRLGALLHDVGHGPLSHVIEEVMPQFPSLNLKILPSENRKATHEDYTLKYLTDSELTPVLRKTFPDLDPFHIACLIDNSLSPKDDFFRVGEVDYRPVLSQLISSELDCDRMDYLERDSYFCGTNYGKIDLHWMLANLGVHVVDNRAMLSLNRRALYTFDDFLISRHHMHLMVYFHHKSIVYEEMLHRYLTSQDCQFFLPSEIADYTNYTDSRLYEHLKTSQNIWAQRISQKKPYKVLIELHNTQESSRPIGIMQALETVGIYPIHASSSTRLSKYHTSLHSHPTHPIYVVDQYDKWDRPMPIHESTEIFSRYEGTRIIDRIYVSPEDHARGKEILQSRHL